MAYVIHDKYPTPFQITRSVLGTESALARMHMCTTKIIQSGACWLPGTGGGIAMCCMNKLLTMGLKVLSELAPPVFVPLASASPAALSLVLFAFLAVDMVM